MAAIDEFLDHLETSQLVPAALVAKLRERVADARQVVDPRTVGKYLIDHGKLSTWQVNQLLAGRTAFYLGRYRLVDRIGQGGMGVVFKAQHAVMDRVVAIKVLNRALLSNPQAVARFNREVKTAAALNHPNIIGAYDADAAGNTHFLVMEYADGCDLNRWLRAHGPFDAAAACECVRQAAEGLHHAWRQGLVHRDIKPVNLLVTWNRETERPVVKILDMGLARFASESSEDGGLTRIGQTIGTPDYIAPEAAENFKGADIRADLFSLGCTLFKLLTGRLPFAGNNTMEKLLARTKADAPPLTAVCPSAPADLAPVLAKMLARDPADRYQTPAEVIAALTPFAALSTGQAAAVGFLRTVPGQNEPVALSDLEPDADTTLAEFFRDCSAAPAREEITPGDRPAPRQVPPSPPAAKPSISSDEDLELAPIEEDEKAGSHPATAVHAPPASQPVATAGHSMGARPDAIQSTKSAAKSKSKKPESSGPALAPVPDLDDLGPLGGGLVDDGLGSPAGDLASDSSLLTAAGPALTKRKKRPDNVWDSPLLLGAGGTLIFLVIAGAALWWLIGRRDSDEMLNKAMASYRAGNYPVAIESFAAFLDAFPNHERASLARVWTSLARLRMATTPGTDKGSVTAARQIVPEITGESAAAEAREELGSILPALAESLAAAAGREQSTELVDAAREARTLVDDYVPKAQRPGQRLAEIDASLELTSRQIARGSALAQAVAEMRAAAEKGDAASAYATRRQLLKTYPDTIGEASLIEALVTVSTAQQKAVVFHDDRKPADSTPLEWPWQASATLVVPPTMSGTSAGSAATPTKPPTGAAVAALAADAIYALDATTGAVRWRRQVGMGNDIWPQPVSTQPDADWLVVDRRRHELWRLGAATGELRWRQSTGTAAAAAPVVVGSTAWLATRDGHLLAIDLESGALAKRIDLPQPLETAPALDPAGKHIYQLGEHSNLYVLSPDSGACDQVVYLGHETGAIRAAPVVASRYLLIAENNRLDNSVLRVLVTDEQGASPKEVQQLPLAGHLHVPPVIVDRACLVVTDLGGVYTFEINPPDQPTALTKLAETPPTDSAHLARQFAVRPGQLWIGSDRLTRWDLQLARGRQTPGLVQLENETFVGPIRLCGNVLVATRHAAGGRGIAVAAVDADSGKVLWDTRLAIPFVGGAVVEPTGDLLALCNSGELFDIKPADLADGDHIFSNPVTTIDAAPPLGTTASVMSIGKQLRLYSSGASDGRLLIGGAGNTGAQRLAWLSLPDAAAAVPAVLGTSLLVPNSAGRVLLLDPRGRELASPSQPPFEAGVKVAWRDPAVWGADRAVLSDQSTNVYLLGIEQQPTPRLSLLREAKATAAIASPWAVLGDKAVAVAATQQLLSFSLPGLAAAAPIPVPGPVVWGPKVVGDRLYLATATELVCFDSQLQISWQSPLLGGALAGTPAASTQGLLIASTGGRIWLVSPETGQATWTVEFGVPLAGGPVVWGDRFVVTGSDGTLYVAKPK